VISGLPDVPQLIPDAIQSNTARFSVRSCNPTLTNRNSELTGERRSTLALASFHTTAGDSTVLAGEVAEYYRKRGWQFARDKGTFLLTSPWGNMATPGGVE